MVAATPGVMEEGWSGMERQVWPGSSSGMGVVLRGVKSDWDWGSGGFGGVFVRLWELKGWLGGGRSLLLLKEMLIWVS
jgi:hypothetical protein